MNIFRRALILFCTCFTFLFAANALALDIENTRVYTMTNEVDGNQVLQFIHKTDGELVPFGHPVKTGGLGTGGGLGNQGAVFVNSDARRLFVVNAGSDTVSVFEIRHYGLKLLDVVASQGSRPISVTQHGDFVYVLNAGSDSIAGFRMNLRGKLEAMPFSVRPLSGSGTGPAQISFTPRGDALVVTEKATNIVTTYLVNGGGLPSDPIVNGSAGITPFGFGFDRYGHLLVSEATGGADDASSVSSYHVLADGSLDLLDAAVPTTESAACWLVASRDGRRAFITNTRSASITAISINELGDVSLDQENGVAVSTGVGTSPIDLVLSASGRYIYALSAASGSIDVFFIDDNGELNAVSSAAGLPTSVNGLAAF